jgi:hypothetical protein
VLKAWLASALLCLVAACGGGGSSEPANEPPHAAVLASGDVRADGGAMAITLGGLLRLDASGSTDQDADDLSYEWSLSSRPAGSTAAFTGGTGPVVEWTPDAMGTYTFTLKVTDAHGATATADVSVTVDNHPPASSLLVTPQFTAEPSTAPTQSVTVGAVVLLDANASTDPDGDALSIAFELIAKPAGSSAALTTAGKSARLTTDAKGLFKVQVTGNDGRGGSFVSIYSFDADNLVPNPVVAATVDAVVAQGGSQTIQASVGYDVVLNSGASTDPDGNAITRAWTMNSRPAGSSATLSSSNAQSTGLSPDVLGDYVVLLTVTDSHGAKSEYTTTVSVNNRRPVANIATNATPQSLPSAPAVLVPLGTTVTLRGSLSTDADGDTLSYAWTVASRPAGSTAALSATNVADPSITPDVEGSYQFRLRATDPQGAFSERVITLNVGSHAPVAVVDRSRVTVMAGSPASMSGAMSFDEDGDALTYSWSLDAKPASSTATISNATTSTLSFSPDIAGTYVVALTVRDGSSASIVYVTVKAMAQLSNTVALSFVPDDAKYSRGLDKLVIAAGNPDALRIVDPFVGSIKSVSLPTTVKNFSLSPDGKLAIVLHEGAMSLVDLDAGTLIHTSSTAGSQTDAFVTNEGIAFLIGQTGGQWVDEGVVTIDGRTGTKIEQPDRYWLFYGTQYGVFADKLNKVLLMSQGLSPADIDYFTFDPATNLVTDAGDSPYHGDYSMGTPLFLSESQDLVFTAYGTYFRSDTLRYAGKLSGVDYTQSMSHSSANEELLVLPWSWSSSNYPSSYKRFSGSLLMPDTDLNMPLVNGSQSYGIRIFHSGSGAHVMLAQTGTDEPQGQGAQYYVLVR